MRSFIFVWKCLSDINAVATKGKNARMRAGVRVEDLGRFFFDLDGLGHLRAIDQFH